MTPDPDKDPFTAWAEGMRENVIKAWEEYDHAEQHGYLHILRERNELREKVRQLEGKLERLKDLL